MKRKCSGSQLNEDNIMLGQKQSEVSSDIETVNLLGSRNRRRVTRSVYILAFVGGVGGFLFGYDTGLISGALPYITDDLLQEYMEDQHQLKWIQGLIVSATVIGAVFGSAFGGYMSDLVGRKRTLLISDPLFAVGAFIMCASQNASQLIFGRFIAGLGVGLASVTVPVYIAECAPTNIRATLVTANTLLITGGQFISYFVNWVFTFVPGTWRWMLGVASVPPILQFIGLLMVPESPKWLAINGNLTQAQQVLVKLRNEGEDVEGELSDLKEETKTTQTSSVLEMLRSPLLRSELTVGVGLQVLQQLGGINLVMYYTPAILSIAGVRDNRQALLMSMLPALVNAIGTIVGMQCIDRFGRRALLISSCVGVVIAHNLLGLTFKLAEQNSPLVADSFVSAWGAINSTCPAIYQTNIQDCTTCLRDSCGFCGPRVSMMSSGACINVQDEQLCESDSQSLYYINGCPSPYNDYILLMLIVYILAFSPGMGPVPWAMNAEIYPVQFRGVGSGVAATANWIANSIVAQTFLVLTSQLQASGTFWLYSAIVLVGTILVVLYLPETKGLELLEVQQLFEKRIQKSKQNLLQPASSA